ncbi:MAG: hypothetical protein J0I09_08340 [Sphingobacteriia bacterium]|nr:hypothetical protein [Sphingobacteriia bacterium]
MINFSFKKIINSLLLFALVLTFIYSFVLSYKITQESIGLDFAIRLNGLKRIINNENGYYILQKNDTILTRLTSTPFLTRLHQPLLKISYCDSRLIFWVIQNILFVSALILLFFSFKEKLKKKLTYTMLTGILFSLSNNWYMHIDRGQVYILFVFLSCFIFFILKKSKKINIILPLLLFFFLVRPISFVYAFLFRKKSSFSISLIIICFAVLIINISTNEKYSQWMYYFKSMSMYAKEVPNSLLKKKFAKINDAVYLDSSDCSKGLKIHENYNSGCIQSVQLYLGKLKIIISQSSFFTCAIIILWILSLIAESKIIKENDVNRKFLLVYILYLITELLIPAPRYGYYIIEWLPIGYIIFASGRKYQMVLFGFGIGLNNYFIASHFTHYLHMVYICSSCLMATSAVFYLSDFEYPYILRKNHSKIFNKH